MKKALLAATLLLSATAMADEWYIGGTLHGSDAKAWCAGSPNNQLATAGDWVSSMWSEKTFNPTLQSKLTSMDDIKDLATQLYAELNLTLCNGEVARPEMINQLPAEMAIKLMVMAGWMEL